MINVDTRVNLPPRDLASSPLMDFWTLASLVSRFPHLQLFSFFIIKKIIPFFVLTTEPRTNIYNIIASVKSDQFQSPFPSIICCCNISTLANLYPLPRSSLFLYNLVSKIKMAATRDRGIRIAIDVSCNEHRLLSNTLVLILNREEVHSPIALGTQEVERWKMT